MTRRTPFPAALSDSRPAVIVGSGPSLARFDFTQLDDRRVNVIGINDQAWMNLDQYRCDWWIYQDAPVHKRYHRHSLPQGVQVLGKIGKFRNYPVVWEQGRCWDWPGDVDRTSTTATSAIQFAGFLGARHVALLGIDCTTGYYWPTECPSTRANAGFLASFKKLLNDQGVPGDPEITQCSIGSPLTMLRKETFDDWRARVLTDVPHPRVHSDSTGMAGDSGREAQGATPG